MNTSWNQNCWEKYQEPQTCRRYHSNGRKWRGTKEPLEEGKRGEWKNWLKTQHSKNEDHGIQSHYFMANRWGNSGRFSFVSKINADGDFSHGIKRHLLLGRKAMTKLDSILKSWDIILLTKVWIIKAVFFLVAMYGYEGWTIRKDEHRRIYLKL